MPYDSTGVTFLLGAGASIPAGMPCTAQITERVLSGEGVTCDLGYAYRIRSEGASNADGLEGLDRSGYVTPVVEYLRRLHDRFAPGHRERCGVELSYEDLYYIASQVAGHMGNPMIGQARDLVRAETEEVEKARPRVCGSGARLSPESVWRDALAYIQGVVVSLVERKPGPTRYLRVIDETWHDPSVSQVSLATLNHDRVAEEFLGENSIPYSNGFGRLTGGTRRFEPAVFGAGDRVRLLHLHGSVDWLSGSYAQDRPDEADEQLSLVEGRGAYEEHLSRGYVFDRFPVQIGTYNKIINYTLNPILGDLQYWLRRVLDESDIVVAAGYGAGDYGVNARVRHWLRDRRGRHLVVIDPHPEGPVTRWSGWVLGTRGLVVMEQGIEGTSWADITHAVRDRQRRQYEDDIYNGNIPDVPGPPAEDWDDMSKEQP
jgi:hypothetical protein